MKNKMTDLNNALFEQIERLQNDELSSDELEAEIKRSAAVVQISGQIIANASLAVKAQQIQAEYAAKEYKIPTYLSEGKDE